MSSSSLLTTLLHTVAVITVLCLIAATVPNVRLQPSSISETTSVVHAASRSALETVGTAYTPQQPWCPVSGSPALPAHIWLHITSDSKEAAVVSDVFSRIFRQYGILPSKWRTADDVGVTKHWKKFQAPSIAVGMVEALGKLQLATDHPFMAITSHTNHARNFESIVKQPVMRFTSVNRIQSPAATARDIEGADDCYDFSLDWTYDMHVGAYDFVFIEERLHEALVLFMLEYSLLFEDIAYLQPSTVQESSTTAYAAAAPAAGVQGSETQKERDFWEAANERLDRRRAKLEQHCGPDVVAAALLSFEQLLAHISSECSDIGSWSTAHSYSTLQRQQQRGKVSQYEGFCLGDSCKQQIARDSCIRYVARKWQGSNPVMSAPGVKRLPLPS